jgi:hypothetical protein
MIEFKEMKIFLCDIFKTRVCVNFRVEGKITRVPTGPRVDKVLASFHLESKGL